MLKDCRDVFMPTSVTVTLSLMAGSTIGFQTHNESSSARNVASNGRKGLYSHSETLVVHKEVQVCPFG